MVVQKVKSTLKTIKFVYVKLLWSLCAWWGYHASKSLLVKMLTNKSMFWWPSLPFGMDQIPMLITNKECPPLLRTPSHLPCVKLGTFFPYNKQIGNTSYPQLIYLCKHLRVSPLNKKWSNSNLPWIFLFA